MSELCTCCGEHLDADIDDLAMQLCALCVLPHDTHDCERGAA